MTTYISKEQYEKLKQELEYLKSVERKKIAERIKAAVELGDISENAEYDQAISDKERLDRKIFEIERILREAKIVRNQKGGNKILPGVSFEALEKGTSKKFTFTLVGYGEANPREGKISTESPLGKAFFNKKPGDEVEVETPRGRVKYKILKILN